MLYLNIDIVAKPWKPETQEGNRPVIRNATLGLEVSLEHLEIGPVDLLNGREAWTILAPEMRPLLEDFYRTKPLVRLFTMHRDFDLSRLIDRQIDHWHELFVKGPDKQYLEGVRRLGVMHHRLEISMRDFLLAYGWLADRFTTLICASNLPAGQTERLTRSVTRLVHLDMALAASAYYLVYVD